MQDLPLCLCRAGSEAGKKEILDKLSGFSMYVCFMEEKQERGSQPEDSQ